MFDAVGLIQKIRQRIKIFDPIIIGVIFICYTITRLVNLNKFPIFGDEGIYIRWAKVAWHDASWRFISLTDGKQPFQTWGTIPFLKLFPNDALLAGRLFSVATGLFALTGIICLCYYIFGKRAARIAGILYVFTPYFLFYDRMALVDSGVNAFAIWIILFSIVLANNIRLDIALIFGILSGFALLAKSSARIFLGVGYIALLTAHEPIKNIKKYIPKNIRQITNYTILYILVVIIALVIYNIQRLSPFFHFVAEKNNTFIMTPGEFLHNPLAYFFDNIKTIPYQVFSEMGYVICLFGLVGLFVLAHRKKMLALYLFCWLLLPFIIVAFVSKVLFPRYLIFFGSIFTILAAYLLSELHDIKKKSIAWLMIIISIIYFDYCLLFNFKNIPFPAIDRGQYVTGVTAGWGIPELISYAREKAQEKPVILLAEGNFGVIGDQLEVFVRQNDRIFVKGYWPLTIDSLKENQPALIDHTVYIVFSHKSTIPTDWPMKLIKRYDKPGGESSIYLFELTK